MSAVIFSRDYFFWSKSIFFSVSRILTMLFTSSMQPRHSKLSAALNSLGELTRHAEPRCSPDCGFGPYLPRHLSHPVVIGLSQIFWSLCSFFGCTNIRQRHSNQFNLMLSQRASQIWRHLSNNHIHCDLLFLAPLQR